jgi:hypothetical protein
MNRISALRSSLFRISFLVDTDEGFYFFASRWDFNLLAYIDIRVGFQIVGLAVVGLLVVGFLVVGFLVVGFVVGFLVEGFAVGVADVGVLVVGVAVGWLVAYSRSHHNITSLNAVYAYIMTYNVRSDIEGLSGPTFSLAETEALNASLEKISGSEPNLAYKSASPIVPVLPIV